MSTVDARLDATRGLRQLIVVLEDVERDRDRWRSTAVDLARHIQAGSDARAQAATVLAVAEHRMSCRHGWGGLPVGDVVTDCPDCTDDAGDRG